jgi:hypothetical protein
VLAFLAGAAFVALHQLTPSPWRAPAALAILLDGALYATVWAAVRGWSRQAGWARGHRVALVGAALLTYAWVGFLVVEKTPVNLAGQAVLATLAVVTVLLLARSRPQARRVMKLVTSRRPR